MAKYAIKVIKSDKSIVSTWSGPGPNIPIAAAMADHTIEEIDQVQYEVINKAGLLFKRSDGAYRWWWDNGVVRENTDPRPTIRITPTLLELDVGDPIGNIEIAFLNGNGQTDKTMNATMRVKIGGSKLKLNFNQGVANIAVPTDKPLDIQLDTSPHFIAEERARIIVYSDSLFAVE